MEDLCGKREILVRSRIPFLLILLVGLGSLPVAHISASSVQSTSNSLSSLPGIVGLLLFVLRASDDVFGRTGLMSMVTLVAIAIPAFLPQVLTNPTQRGALTRKIGRRAMCTRGLVFAVLALAFSCVYVVSPRLMDAEMYRLGFPFQWLELFRQTYPLAPPGGGPWRMAVQPVEVVLDFAFYYGIILIFSYVLFARRQTI